MREHACNLHEVVEIVRHPSRKKLPRADHAQRRMSAAALEIGFPQPTVCDRCQALRARFGKLIE
jgi:hypothetical protein